ncbi:hypothetical protein ABET41_12105 [Metabacillus fastidiosus]
MYKQGVASEKTATSYTLEFWKKEDGYNQWSTIPEDSVVEGFGFRGVQKKTAHT